MKKYKTQQWDNRIEEIEILYETEKSVWLKSTDVIVNKEDDYERIHDTWELAQQYLLDRAQKTLDRLRENVITYSEKLVQISAMKKP